MPKRTLGQVFPKEATSLALTFVGLVFVIIIFFRILMMLVYVFLQQINVPGPNPKQEILADLQLIWIFSSASAVLWMLKLTLLRWDKRSKSRSDEKESS